MGNITEIIGRLPVPRGAYSAGTTYYKYNLVTLYGSTYMCKSDNVTTAPATKDSAGKVTVNANWEVWADASEVEYIKGLVSDLLRDLGKYATELTVPLSVGKSGKYVDSEGQEKSDSSMSISAPVSLKAGNIYLFPASQAVGTGVSLFARQVTRTYDKVIEYETVSEYYDGRPAEIRAKHDPSLRYEVVYQDDNIYYIKLPRPSGNIVGLLHNPQLTYEVTESFYEPLFRTNDSSMPESGSYLYLCPQDMEMVVSAKTSDISGKSLAGIRYGAFASIMTNFLSNFGQKVVAQALAELYARLESLEAQVDVAGHLKVDVLDMADLPLVCGERMYLTGSGAPATPPTVPFQEYFDTENGKFYKAKGELPDSPTTADWVAIN